MKNDQLVDAIQDARRQTFAIVADLTDDQFIGPYLDIVNPILWEIGHVAWFQEYWILRHLHRQEPLFAHADDLYDSTKVEHQSRWTLDLPPRRATIAYLHDTRERVVERLRQREPTEEERFYYLMSLFHEDMHVEAFAYTRQALGYPEPKLLCDALPIARPTVADTTLPVTADGDATIPGGAFQLGADRNEPFVFDNEKWEHPVDIAPYAMSRTAVTQGEFADFVDDDGYRRPECWTDLGRAWLASSGAEHPVYWRRDGSRWLRRAFDQWVPVEPDRAMMHVNYFEAQAYSSWAGRRLPTEAEWEFAASGAPATDSTAGTAAKRRYPWGDAVPQPHHASLDFRVIGSADVQAHGAGDSAFGCRQMIGNVWEWTQSDFLPFPGFTPDPYERYSLPWFGTRKVLRGGCWATRSRLIRNTWRNYYQPDRRDVLAGFRTCARES